MNPSLIVCDQILCWLPGHLSVQIDQSRQCTAISVHEIHTRAALDQWLEQMTGCRETSHGGTAWITGKLAEIDVTVFFPPSLRPVL